MSKYTLNKVLSNNVVLTEKDGQNYILVGKGIGFSKKQGQVLEKPSVEEKFISLKGLNEDEKESFINTINPKVIEVVKDIVNLVKSELGEKLNPNMYLSFADHLNMAIQRLKDGIDIVNPFLLETKILYPQEYNLAQKAVKIIENKLEIRIPVEEVGFLALHIYGGRGKKNKVDALQKSKLIKEILDFVDTTLKIQLNRNSFSCERFVLHLNGVISRVEENKTIENLLMDKLKFELIREMSIALKIANKIKSYLNKEVPESEIGYIAIHLHKLKGLRSL